MDSFSLCCAACIALGDPAALDAIGTGSVTFDASTATSFGVRSLAAETAHQDGFALDSVRLGIATTPHGAVRLRAALDTDLDSFEGSEAVFEATPVEGLRIRGGRWRVGPGPVSGRREAQRCFVDAPLATERFLGADGLVDQGLELRYRTPGFPVDIAVAILSGVDAESFDAPYRSGSGATVFEQLLYSVGLRAHLGTLFGQPLAAGVTFLTGQNGSGPDNRTDMVSADLSGRVRVDEDWAIGFDVEYLLRRHGVPFALVVEGGLSTDVTLFWRQAWLGLRYDAFGLPLDPRQNVHPFRFTAAAGWALTPLIQVRGQYSVRDDTAFRQTAHEGLFQVIVGWSGSAGIASQETGMARHPVTRPEAPPLTAEAWLGSARDALEVSETLVAAARHAAASSAAQQAAYASLRSRVQRLGIKVPLADRAVISMVEALARDGNAPPPELWTAARELDRHADATEPSRLGGAPSRLYDRPTAEKALDSARAIVAWSQGEPPPPPPPPVLTPPVLTPPVLTPPAPTPVPPEAPAAPETTPPPG